MSLVGGVFSRAKNYLTTQLAQLAAGSGRLEKLDMLRGIAVLLVLFSHLTLLAYPAFGIWELAHCNFGTIGVFIFFCVSGYVICWSMGDLSALNGSKAASAFAVRRFFRLLPPYLILASLIWLVAMPARTQAAVVLSIHASPFWYWVRFITLTSSFGGDKTVYRGIEWTLAYEVTFYAACTLFIALFAVIGRRRLLYAVAVLMCAAVLLPPEWSNNVVQNFFCNFTYFGIGVVAYLRRANVLSKKEFLALSILFAGTAILRVAYVDVNYHTLFSETFATPIAITIFYAGLYGTQLRAPLLAAIGTISFSIYLLHKAVTALLPLTDMPAWTRPIAWLLVALAAGTVSFLFIEQSAIRAGKSVVGWMRRPGRYIKRSTSAPALSVKRAEIW